MREKQGIVKYVNICKKLFVAFAIVALPAFLVSLVFACMQVTAFYFITPAVGVLFFVVYSAYALKISMGTVLGIELTQQVVHIRTKRKTFTYDVRTGCVGVRVSKRRFVATFETQDSRDTFTFLRRAPFSRYYEEQFTLEEIRAFYPDCEEVA